MRIFNSILVKSMSDCDHVLLEGTPPQIPGVLKGGKILNQNRYKPICQTYRNKRRFVTLYDIKNRIPVFSAYKYRGVEGKGRPKKHWKIDHQAVDTDFRSNGTFDRGHVIPSSYGSTENDKRSTFTLTNIVPQAGSFNKGSWNRMESCVRCVMDKYCTNSSGFTEGFVVTGAQPSSSNILNNRVNIPSTLWTAFCCYSADMNVWIASAHWGNNVPDVIHLLLLLQHLVTFPKHLSLKCKHPFVYCNICPIIFYVCPSNVIICPSNVMCP
uniref:Uncharacterized protein n=1 Tax=Acanthochromis polyacanthus TaxID=80966 RepID=A0A3Q1GW19_9TELE